MAAAANNAAWCDAVCRARGLPTQYLPAAWCCDAAPPPYYPGAVSLEAGALQASLLTRLAGVCPGEPRAFKDSHACLDLTGLGYTPMFDARWLHRAPVDAGGDRGDAASQLRWQAVDSRALLAAWEAAWWPEPDCPCAPGTVYDPRLLRDATVCLLAGLDGAGRIAAGAAVTDAAGVLGLSALFGGPAADPGWRHAVLAEVDRRWPGRALVGYEQGDELVAMRRCGFDDVGPLRVWWRAAGAELTA